MLEEQGLMEVGIGVPASPRLLLLARVFSSVGILFAEEGFDLECMGPRGGGGG